METGDTRIEGGDPGTPSNVVRFPGGWLGPRDWLGPREELVPLGTPTGVTEPNGKCDPAHEAAEHPVTQPDHVRARARESSPITGEAPTEPETPAAAFWEGSAIHDAMPATAINPGRARTGSRPPRAWSDLFRRLPGRRYARVSFVVVAAVAIVVAAVQLVGARSPARVAATAHLNPQASRSQSLVGAAVGRVAEIPKRLTTITATHWPRRSPAHRRLRPVPHHTSHPTATAAPSQSAAASAASQGVAASAPSQGVAASAPSQGAAASAPSQGVAASAPPSSPPTDASTSAPPQSGATGVTAASDVQQSSAPATQTTSPAAGPTGPGALIGPGSTPSG